MPVFTLITIPATEIIAAHDARRAQRRADERAEVTPDERAALIVAPVVDPRHDAAHQAIDTLGRDVCANMRCSVIYPDNPLHPLWAYQNAVIAAHLAHAFGFATRKDGDQ